MSKITKLCRCLSWTAINQSITVLLFFHSLGCKFSETFLFMLTKITLLIFPRSFSTGLVSPILRLFWKFHLHSFSDMKHCFVLFVCILSKTLLFTQDLLPNSIESFSIICFLWLSDTCLPFYLQMSLFYFMLSFFLKSCWSRSWKWFLSFLNFMLMTNEINSFLKRVSSFTSLNVSLTFESIPFRFGVLIFVVAKMYCFPPHSFDHHFYFYMSCNK